VGADGRTTPVRVAIDATSLLGARSGVGYVTAGLVAGLARRPEDVVLLPYGVTRAPASRLSAELPGGLAARTTRVPASILFAVWSRADWPRVEQWTGPVDVVHGTNFVVPPSRAPQLVTVYDLTFLRSPELCAPGAARYGDLIRGAIRRGATLHVLTDHVGAELRDAFGVGSERVRRVYYGVAPTAGGDRDAGRHLAGAERYVLALGTVEPRKNLPTLVRAFDRVAARDPQVVLAVAGADGWGVAEYEAAVARAGHGGRIHRLGYVDDRQRRDLLAGARVLAYPSLDEGFGLPPLEAMAAGVPVVAAATGSLPEALGDAALLVNPRDDAGLAAAIELVLEDAAVRGRLIDRGHTQVARYSWDDCCRNMLELYREVSGVS
jgi:glycosyltransferase involved in cell wall biosynthesis